jgi:hypothetical protein
MFMSTSTEMVERHGRVLAELSELGLTLARAVHAKAMAAETPQQACELGLAFHRISRSVRQTLALEARLERDRVRLERDKVQAEAEAQRHLLGSLPQRKARVRAAVEQLIWTEAETDEIEGLLEDLETHIEITALGDDFLVGSVQDQVDRIRAQLGFPPPGTGEGIPPAHVIAATRKPPGPS